MVHRSCEIHEVSLTTHNMVSKNIKYSTLFLDYYNFVTINFILFYLVYLIVNLKGIGLCATIQKHCFVVNERNINIIKIEQILT